MTLRKWQSRTFWLLWITYASFYLGRVNLSVALPGIMREFNWTRADVGAIGTALFWAYAIGQFVNGLVGDRVGARAMITIGLVASAVMNLTFANETTLVMFVVIWAVNGYVQAMGWGPVVKTLANWFPSNQRGRISGRLGTCYILGGAISVALAGFVASKTDDWRAIFIVPSGLLVLSAVHWYLRARNSPTDVGLPVIERVAGRESLRLSWRKSVGNLDVWLMGAGLFFINIVRYGFLTWAATYLFEVQGATIAKAAYSSILFPVAGAAGALLAGWASDRLFKSKRAPVACICLLLAGWLCWVYRFAVPVSQWVLGLAVLASIGFFVFGSHVLVVGAAPMDYGTRKAASAATGLIDSLGYVGAGLTSVGTGILVDRWGWNAGFTMWVAAAFLAAGVMLPLIIRERK